MSSRRASAPATMGLAAAVSVAASALATAGCEPTPRPRPPLDAPQVFGGRPVLETAAAVAGLPEDTELVWAARSATTHRRLLGAGPLDRRSADGFSLAVEAMGEAGLDPTAPTGGFVADAERRVEGTFAAVADRARLEAWWGELARGRGEVVSTTVMGEGVVVAANVRPRRWLVIRAGHAYLLAARGHPADGAECARRIAAAEPTRGLGATARFRALVREMEGGADAAVYARSASLLQRELGIWDRQADRLLGALPGAVVVIDADVDRARVEAFIAVRPDSLLDRALRTDYGEEPPLHGAPAAPTGVLSGRVRRDHTAEIARAVMATTGDPAEVERRLETAFGSDLDRSVFAELSGEVGVGWSSEGWSVFATIAPDEIIDMSRVASRPDDPFSIRIVDACPRRGSRCLLLASDRSYDAGWLVEGEGPGAPPAQARRGGAFLTVNLDRFEGDGEATAAPRIMSLVGRRVEDGIVFRGSYPIDPALL